jgi:C4-dicarboxylate transporter DctM subunit
MDSHSVGIVGIVFLILALLSGMPVGFVMAFVGLAGCTYLLSLPAALTILVNDMYALFMSYTLTVIPMFILMGTIAFHSGMTRRLFACANEFFGFLPGGLAIGTIGACAAFSAICGSTNATAAAMATVALPEMKRFHYDNRLASGVVAAGGSLGILIPPSVIFIIYGILTQTSIGKLFAAGILPGILLSLLFIAAIVIWVSLRPELGPRGPKSSFGQKLASLPGIMEILGLFAVVIGGLFTGVFTPTEAGAVGAFGSILLSLFLNRLTWRAFFQSILDTARMSCMILMIVVGATVFGRFLAVTRIPFEIAAWVGSLALPSVLVMTIIIFIYFIGGFFMDSFALILLTIPIFFPVVVKLGYDPVWFGVIIVLITEMGVITPPVGINVYVVSGIAKDIPLQDIFVGVLPLLCSMIVCIIVLLIFPGFTLILPRLIR